jgi:putative ABC transport system permease protein
VLLPLTLTIVGVTSPATSAGGGGPALELPYGTAKEYWGRMQAANGWLSDEFYAITLEADSAGSADKVRDEVKKLGYPAVSGNDQIKQMQQIFLFLGLGLSAFGAIALFVAALGIANTMYTAVLERTREIGILKALGARSADVRSLFMAEAAAVGALGGAVGVLVTLGLSVIGNAIVNQIASQQGFGLDLNIFQLPVWLAVAAIALAAAFSALAGLLPAIRAARLNPVLALRYE